MRASWSAVALLAFGACIPGGPGTPRPSSAPRTTTASSAAPSSTSNLSDAPDGDATESEVATHAESLERIAGAVCPIAFADANVVLARVGDVTITACDLVVARERDRREGRTLRDDRDMLSALVDEALLANEARARQLDSAPDVARRVDETLANVLVRTDALADVRHELPDDAAVQHYYDTHRDEFAVPEMVHLRLIVVASESAAREIIAASANTTFDALVSRSIDDATGRRDGGDLGWVPEGGNDRVAASIAQAGFALTEPGSVAQSPVRVVVTVLVGRHHRPRSQTRWHVIELLERRPASVTPFNEAAPSIRHRLSYGRFDSARRAAHDRLVAATRHASPPEIQSAALRRVRLRAEPIERPHRSVAHRSSP
jgi:parvulin-like peptidyl-prolyl isomerase